MTDDDKALVERLKRFSTRPIEHDAPAMNRVAMKEAADRIEAQAAEIEDLRQTQNDALNIAREGLGPFAERCGYADFLELEATDYLEGAPQVAGDYYRARDALNALAALEQSK